MPRIALLTRYDSKGASSRVRTLQYLPTLHAAGIETEHFPLFGNDYLESLYHGENTTGLRIRALLNRIFSMRSITRKGRFDLLWIEKELLPYLPYGLEKWLLRRGVPYMLDFDDAIFHNYDQSDNILVRGLMGDKIDRLMAGSRLVLCGNGYLGERARRAGAPWVEVQPPTIDFEKYRQQPEPEQPVITDSRPLRVIWIGSPTTSTYLDIVREAFERVAAQYPIQLDVIGGDARQWPTVKSTHIPWSSSTEAGELSRSHVGIMPLEDNLWENGKCGFKLIQYMAAGLPVIGSAVGMNRDIVIPGENGFLATSTDTWAESLETLIASPELRVRLGHRGREDAENRYSIAAVGPRLVQLLREAAQP